MTEEYEKSAAKRRADKQAEDQRKALNAQRQRDAEKSKKKEGEKRRGAIRSRTEKGRHRRKK